MSVGLDTSVVLRLLVGEPVAQAAAAWKFVVEQSQSAGGPASVSDMVVGECYFALRHHYGVPHAGAIVSLRGLLGDPRLRPAGVARDVLAQAQSARSAGPGLMDRLIHADYERDASPMVTFDRAAGVLPRVRVLKP